MVDLTPPRHIPTLPDCVEKLGWRALFGPQNEFAGKPVLLSDGNFTSANLEERLKVGVSDQFLSFSTVSVESRPSDWV
jgi:hypothetical protein